MTNHRINSNDNYITEVSVAETDKYTNSVYLKFQRHYVPEEVRGVNEMFLTIDEFEQLAKFFQNEANNIRTKYK